VSLPIASYELAVVVPADARAVGYGLALEGGGRAWLDDVSVEVVP